MAPLPRLPRRDNISLQLDRHRLDFFRGKQGTIGIVHGRTGTHLS